MTPTHRDMNERCLALYDGLRELVEASAVFPGEKVLVLMVLAADLHHELPYDEATAVKRAFEDVIERYDPDAR